jgi:hypothetical protein
VIASSAFQMARKRLEATAFLDHFANGELADCPLPPIAVCQHFFYLGKW